MPADTTQQPDLPQRGRRATDRSITGLVTGFVIVGIVMLLLIGIALHRMSLMQEALESVVHNHMSKVRLVTQMRIAARERTLGLHRMLNLEDEFDRHDEWMRFNANATRFAAARIELTSLPIAKDEVALLETQAEWTRKTVPFQNEVVDLVMAGEIEKARKVLIQSAIPMQDKVLQQLDILSDAQERWAQAATTRTLGQYENTRALVIVLTALALVLCAIIAATVIRRTRSAARRLHTEKERAQVTLYSIGDGVITTNAEGRVESLNAAAKRITGWSTHEAQGQELVNIVDVTSADPEDSLGNLILRAMEEGQVLTQTREVMFRKRSFDEHVIEATAAPIRDESADISGAVLVFRDITEMHALAAELRIHASHDSLTGLLNRREFENCLTQAVHESREEGAVHTMCYLDLDMFKVVNDTCGHMAGDELLRQVSSQLLGRVRRSDVVARLGGDEFGLLLEDCNDEVAVKVCEEIRSTIKNHRFIWEDKSFEIGVSIGIVPITAEGGGTHEVMRAADIAVYQAKDQGRNRIVTHKASDVELSVRHGEINWLQRINQALEENRFQLYFQAILPLQESSNERMHGEVLLRMLNEDGDIISPMSFLPAAERFHLMPVLDRWVIHRAFEDIARIMGNPSTRVDGFNINLSGQTLTDTEFLGYIRDELASSGAAPGDICFEVTETAAISNLSAASELVEELRRLGFRFALDDFGSGLSSFGYLKSLQVDYLKIDGTFVRDIATDTADHAMVRSINQVAHVMGIKTVAEYIEDKDTHIVAIGIGIDFGQGMYLSKPIPLDHLMMEPIDFKESISI